MKSCTQLSAADFELDERHVIKNEKVALDRMSSSTERISCLHEHFRHYSRWNAESANLKIIGLLIKCSLLAAV